MHRNDTRAITEIVLRYRIGDRHFEVAMSPRAVDALLLGDAVDHFDNDGESSYWEPKHAAFISPPKPIAPVGGRHEELINGDGPLCVHLYPCWIVCFPPEWTSPDFNPGDPFDFDPDLRDLDPRVGGD